ncbi:NUDIX domain-containing protein [Chitinivorax sp. PXF-14]|uniref:NUDIX hydrolase n=1 Tax=Chitinivorax sp. PXF-14 TaxID=3230488 RepID=UPI003467B06C
MSEALIRPVVSIIVQRIADDGQARILLQRRTKPGEVECWELPQGKIRVGETLHTAARRELAEETGMQLGCIVTPGIAPEAESVAGNLLQCFDPASCVLDISGQYLAVCIVAEASGEPVATAEACGHRWLTAAELRLLLAAERVFPLNLPMLKNFLRQHSPRPR